MRERANQHRERAPTTNTTIRREPQRAGDLPQIHIRTTPIRAGPRRAPLLPCLPSQWSRVSANESPFTTRHEGDASRRQAATGAGVACPPPFTAKPPELSAAASGRTAAQRERQVRRCAGRSHLHELPTRSLPSMPATPRSPRAQRSLPTRIGARDERARHQDRTRGALSERANQQRERAPTTNTTIRREPQRAGDLPQIHVRTTPIRAGPRRALLLPCLRSQWSRVSANDWRLPTRPESRR